MYSTDVTDFQWQVIEGQLHNLRKRKYSLREVLNVLLYLTKTGLQWRMLPNDLPPFPVVYYYFKKWKLDGTIKRINQLLVRKYRVEKQGRKGSPSVGIMDSQSVKNSEWGVHEKGFDGNKKVKGRKRNILVDTFGFLLVVSVHAANINDGIGARNLLHILKKQGYERIKRVLGDKAYTGGGLVKWALQTFGWSVEISPGLKSLNVGFEPIPQRWKVERSISWLLWERRLSRDYEETIESAETFVYLANIRRLIRKF